MVPPSLLTFYSKTAFQQYSGHVLQMLYAWGIEAVFVSFVCKYGV
jgi:hypothetical protein